MKKIKNILLFFYEIINGYLTDISIDRSCCVELFGNPKFWYSTIEGTFNYKQHEYLNKICSTTPGETYKETIIKRLDVLSDYVYQEKQYDFKTLLTKLKIKLELIKPD